MTSLPNIDNATSTMSETVFSTTSSQQVVLVEQQVIVSGVNRTVFNKTVVESALEFHFQTADSVRTFVLFGADLRRAVNTDIILRLQAISKLSQLLEVEELLSTFVIPSGPLITLLRIRYGDTASLTVVGNTTVSSTLTTSNQQSSTASTKMQTTATSRTTTAAAFPEVPPLSDAVLTSLEQDYEQIFSPSTGQVFDTINDPDVYLFQSDSEAECIQYCTQNSTCRGLVFLFDNENWRCIGLSNIGQEDGVTASIPSYSFKKTVIPDPTLAPSSNNAAALGTEHIALISLLVPLALVVFILVLVRRYDKNKAVTFEVVVEQKQPFRMRIPDHPWTGRGSDLGFAIRRARTKLDFVPGETLRLVRGRTYHFKMCNVSKDYPFYISYSDTGGGNGIMEYLRGVQHAPAIDNDILTFTPPKDSPSILYYQCTKHKCMGYKILLSDDDSDQLSPLESVVTITDSNTGVFSPNEHILEGDDEVGEGFNTSRVSFRGGFDNSAYDSNLFDDTDLQLHDDDPNGRRSYDFGTHHDGPSRPRAQSHGYDFGDMNDSDSGGDNGAANMGPGYDFGDDDNYGNRRLRYSSKLGESFSSMQGEARASSASVSYAPETAHPVEYRAPPHYASALRAVLHASETRETPQYVPPPRYEFARRFHGSQFRDESLDSVYRPPPPYLFAALIERTRAKQDSLRADDESHGPVAASTPASHSDSDARLQSTLGPETDFVNVTASSLSEIAERGPALPEFIEDDASVL